MPHTRNFGYPRKPPQFEVKKALDPIAVLGVAGLFVVGKFAGAFASRLGTDAAAALSAKLKQSFAHEEDKQTRLLRFEFEFEYKGRCTADVILTSPGDADIDSFFGAGLRQLDLMLPACLDQIDGLVRYVFTFADGRAQLKFAVRRDAVPVFPTADHEQST